MRISDWSSDVCSSDLEVKAQQGEAADQPEFLGLHGKDEGGLFLGQEVELALGALHEALAGERHGTEADHRLQRVVAGDQRIVLRAQEGKNPVLLVVV